MEWTSEGEWIPVHREYVNYTEQLKFPHINKVVVPNVVAMAYAVVRERREVEHKFNLNLWKIQIVNNQEMKKYIHRVI